MAIVDYTITPGDDGNYLGYNYAVGTGSLSPTSYESMTIIVFAVNFAGDMWVMVEGNVGEASDFYVQLDGVVYTLPQSDDNAYIFTARVGTDPYYYFWDRLGAALPMKMTTHASDLPGYGTFNIHVGGTPVDKFMLGTSEVTAIYNGTTLVFGT